MLVGISDAARVDSPEKVHEKKRQRKEEAKGVAKQISLTVSSLEEGR
jgi:hypothetical protein